MFREDGNAKGWKGYSAYTPHRHSITPPLYPTLVPVVPPSPAFPYKFARSYASISSFSLHHFYAVIKDPTPHSYLLLPRWLGAPDQNNSV